MATSRRLQRGIYLVPTLFTIGNLFCGFFSLIETFRGRYGAAALAIVIAGVLDGLDGRLARLTGTTSDFGNEFDSLADIVSFGVAPALLIYHWALEPLGRIGWLVAFLFVVSAATRLARFNIQAGTADKRFFAGLPSPSAAGVLASLAFAYPEHPTAPWAIVASAVAVVAVGLLMISRVRYRSFKEFDLRSRRSYVYVLPISAMLVAIAVHPQIAMLTFAGAYTLSGPALYVAGIGRRARTRAADDEAGTLEELRDGPGLR